MWSNREKKEGKKKGVEGGANKRSFFKIEIRSKQVKQNSWISDTLDRKFKKVGQKKKKKFFNNQHAKDKK